MEEQSKQLIAEVLEKRKLIREADLTWLTTPTKMGEVPHPSLTDVSPRFDFDKGTGCFQFMGRQALQKLKDHINNTTNRSTVNILGTKFYGKSHIIAAYAAQRMQVCFKKEKGAIPLLFLPKLGDLAKLKPQYLKKAMLLTFAGDETLLPQIAELEEIDELLNWLKPKIFDVAADQGNDIEEKQGKAEEDARELMTQLMGIVSNHKRTIMTGYSANNEIIKIKFTKERTETDFEFYGGFDEEV